MSEPGIPDGWDAEWMDEVHRLGQWMLARRQSLKLDQADGDGQDRTRLLESLRSTVSQAEEHFRRLAQEHDRESPWMFLALFFIYLAMGQAESMAARIPIGPDDRDRIERLRLRMDAFTDGAWQARSPGQRRDIEAILRLAYLMDRLAILEMEVAEGEARDKEDQSSPEASPCGSTGRGVGHGPRSESGAASSAIGLGDG